VGLFLVPLLVVLASIGVFVGFGWIAYERKATGDYLGDLRSSWKPRRAQAAYELSKVLVADPTALDDDPAARAQVRDLFANSEDETIRRYLALVLGHTRDREAVPLLIGELESADAENRIYSMWALGAIGDQRAQAPLTAALRDRDPGIRKTAAFALGELGEASAGTALEELLEDPVVDVRWNAALALARLGSSAGKALLLEMLDRDLTERIPEITPAQQEEAMVGAVAALAAVSGRGAEKLLENLAAEDPSLKVRQAAVEALRAIRSP